MPGREWIIRSEKNNSLIVFLRAPEPGRVKTRLAGDVGDKRALTLYKSFAAATLAAADRWCDTSRSGEVLLSYYPENKLELMQDWLGRERFYLAQSGADLGRRMSNAMASAFDRGAERVVLVGTDVPQISSRHLEQAFEILHKKDVVLGPSLDGGYWLIGMNRKRFVPDIFSNVNWGSSAVFSETIGRCREYRLTRTDIEVLLDIDTLSDLEMFKRLGLKTGQ
ncbi:MAG: TIGR04282 family arsenosugar biosynthesis glycosyltransferase [Desulfobacterales bacterium]|nr:TIGR04282 family arsenosugar biosynthesis glycosyltransferase [Desulfobacterales bacterium]